MSFIPGADGNKSIFKDGLQVDVISENTLNAGVHVKGMSDGTSVPTGYIGEKIEGTISGDATISVSGASVNIGSITLDPGTWVIYGQLFLGCSSVSGFLYFDGGIGTNTSSMITNSFFRFLTLSDYGTSSPTTPCYVTPITSTTYYLNGRAGFSSIVGGRLVAINSKLFAIRIA
jgi:hypothetical protein